MQVLKDVFYLLALITVEVCTDRKVLRCLARALRYLAELQHYVPDRIVPQTPVHFFDDLWLEERELLHPCRTVYNESHFLAAQGTWLRVPCNYLPHCLLPLTEDPVFLETALKPLGLQHFHERNGKPVYFSSHGESSYHTKSSFDNRQQHGYNI